MKDNNLIYPIVIHPELEGGYSVFVPDINKVSGGSATQGETLKECLYMARDLIGIMLIDKLEYPQPTSLEDIKVKSGDIKTIVDIDMKQYRKRTAKTVRKNVSVPDYLVQMGNERGINFSEILTKALEDKLL